MGPALRLRPDAGIYQTPIEPDGLLGRFKRNGMLCDTLGSKVIRHTANRHNERVVRHTSDRRNFLSVFIIGGREMDQLCSTVQAHHLANPVIEMPPMRLREVVQLFLARVHASRCDGMKKRLPQMGA
jgi:hypothetical protein